MKVFINSKNNNYYNIIKYILKIIEINSGTLFKIVSSPKESNLIWDELNPNSQNIDINFYNNLKNSNSNLSHENILKKSLNIYNQEKKIDEFATIFYLLNCIQESNPKKENLDQIGRFKYESTYQFKYKTIEQNTVQNKIDGFLQKNNIISKKEKSNFFLSHDIDSLYGSLKQDGFWAVKNLKIDVILKILVNFVINKPHWKNIDKILNINSEYEIRSTFFWLVNHIKGEKNISNADYKINKVQDIINQVSKSNSINGLHKSSVNMTLDQELVKGKNIGQFNRYHYLSFLPEKNWPLLSNSKIEFDSSLGFAERYGFRNSYGKSFQPFDYKNDRLYNFISAPLVFMDRTFSKYMDSDVSEIGNTIIEFYEKNKTNCDISLLWHNNYFTNYKYGEYIKEYKKVIQYIYENNIETVTPKDIIKENKIIW